MTVVPSVGPLPAVDLSDVSDTTTAAGVRVVTVRRPNVPLVQVRLSVPMRQVATGDTSVLRLLPKTLLSGTGERSGSEVAAAFQRLGMLVGTGADVDDLAVSACIPSAVLHEAIGLLVEVVAHPSFPQDEVRGERERVVQDVLQESVDPIAIATRALDARLFRRHPYAEPLPSLAAVRRIGRSRLAQFHAARIRPRGIVVVAVGDVVPERFTQLVEESFGSLEISSDGDSVGDAVPVPAVAARRPGVVLVDRPGAVQSNLRVGVRCPGREDAAFPALDLASTVLGGYFTSRLVENLRERHGYTYSPRAGVSERRHAAAFAIRAEVGTDVTAAALAEVQYELARLATTTVPGDELEAARRYTTGVLSMSAATQAGLAGLLGAMVSQGLDPAYLERFLAELAAVDNAAVERVAAHYLGPAAMTTVVVGDAAAVASTLAPLGEVAVVEA